MSEKPITPLLLQAAFLGGLEIRINGVTVNGLSSQKAKSLFIYLILENDQCHTRSKLASLFWPDVPEQTALHNLRQALSTLRKTLIDCNCFDELLVADREKVVFAESVTFQVDAIDFEKQIRALLESSARKPGRGFPVHPLERLIQQYHQQLLPELTLPDSDFFEDWLMVKRETINRLLIEGISILLKYFEKRCEWGLARKYAELLTGLAPWDEDTHYRLIRVLLQLSQGNLALTQYYAAIHYFEKDLQAEPGKILLTAYNEIQSFLSSGKSQQTYLSPQIKLPGYATPFIGREAEIDTLEFWISNPDTSVITITGPGGSGKTRLAVELANGQNTLFKDGVFFVSVVGCLSSTQLAATILGVVEIGNELSDDAVQDLLDWAHNRSSLLILDNVDNPPEAAILTTRLREVAPNLVLMATSYSPLNLVGEKIYSLKGLGVSNGLASDAVHLFYTHLQSEGLPQTNHPDFSNNALKICELVEGLPLAIDLAACQTKRIPITDILNDLNEKMTLLSSQAANLPERHRSIQASFENVWKHLELREKLILPLITIFKNPFSSEAAESICGATPTELRALSNRSLLIWDGQERYRFHRVVRQCAFEKIELIIEEQERLFKCYAEWFYQHLLDLFNDRKGERIFTFHQNMELILTDILQSLDWYISAKDWKHVEIMITPLNVYFEGRSLYREGGSLFEEYAEKCSDEKDALICRAMFSCRAALFKIRIQHFSHSIEKIQFGLDTATKFNKTNEVAYCLNAKATYAIIRKNASTAVKVAFEALELSRKINNKEEEAHSLYNLGYAQDNMGDIPAAEETLNLCRIICEEQKNWRRLSKVLNILADIACFHGDYHLALHHYEKAIDIVRQLRNKYAESLIMNNIGTAYLELFQYDQADYYFRKSLLICREINDREGEAIALSNLGEMAAYQKDFANAALYNQQALEISLEIESDWGVMSARVILAEAYRELSDKKAAQNELVQLFQMAMQTETMNFFHRGVVEAVRLLLETGNPEGLSSILRETMIADGAEESARKKAQLTLALLPEDENCKEKLEPNQIIKYLLEKLYRI